MKIKAHRLFPVLLLIAAIMCSQGCMKKTLSEKDALTLTRVRETIMPFIDTHSIDHWQYPESYKAMLSSGMDAPINPYTGKPMLDTGTPEWDPETSPGNIHYVPVETEKDMIGNFSIYVFGEKGLIRHIRTSPLAAG